jgi:lipopolysaccharide transport protein LptA
MAWQKKARLAIAAFVLVFAGIVALALMRGKGVQPVDSQIPKRERDPGQVAVENTGGLNLKHTKDGKVVWNIQAAKQFTYKDGHSELRGGVRVESERNGKHFTITGEEADVIPDANGGIKSGIFRKKVKLTTQDGLDVTTTEATYEQAEALIKAPGPVEFSKGRTRGSGVGATYDQNREVLWILERARIEVAPDQKGAGQLDSSANAAGIARADHYVRLTGNARITSEGRTATGDEITVDLTDDDERVEMLQLRGHSNIKGGGQGPQSMSANDIDITYGEDGRTMQFAKLVQNAVAQLAGAARQPGRRVAGNAIDIAMAPDGSTVTNLTANEKVQVDLPPETPDGPTRRIKSDSLVAAGTPNGGLQEATFLGSVDYRETRTARRNLPAINRTARSLKLIAKTKPGFGAIEEASFYGNVHFTDGAKTVADSTYAVYRVATDRLDLMPSDDPGSPPMVSDGKVEVRARTIEFSLNTRSMNADTRVRSTLIPQKPGANGGDSTHMPALLTQDEPVTVTSNRLAYDGAASQATYSGNAALWQGETTIKADTIVLDDKTGNLTAKEKVETVMMMNHTDSKTKEKKLVKQTGRAQLFEYNDGKRVAVYTTEAFLSGPDGDINGDRIELFLKEKENTLVRAEGYGKVILQESQRKARGARLTYTVEDDKYVMTGNPVEVFEKSPPNCSLTSGTTFIFFRSVGTASVTAGNQVMDTKKVPCTFTF